jgi:hypothetical protein
MGLPQLIDRQYINRRYINRRYIDRRYIDSYKTMINRPTIYRPTDKSNVDISTDDKLTYLLVAFLQHRPLQLIDSPKIHVKWTPTPKQTPKSILNPFYMYCRPI